MRELLLLSILLLGCGPSFAAIFTIPNGDVAALVLAMNTANTNGQADVINLAPNGEYVFTTSVATITGLPFGSRETEGPVALPPIEDEAVTGFDLILNLNGSVLRLDSSAPKIRLLHSRSGASWQLNGGTIRDFESLRYPEPNPRNSGGGGGGVALGVSNVFSSNAMVFDNCKSNTMGEERAGGALYVAGGSQVTLTNSTFRNNSGTTHGGAVTVLGSDVRIENCVFDNNRSTVDGGAAIYVDGLRKTSGDNFTGPGRVGEIIGCTFTNNTARTFGAVFLQGYNLDKWVVTNCQFTNNKATNLVSQGGAVFHNTNNNGAFEVSNCTFENNEAGAYGGGVSCGRGDNKFTNCTFYGNKTFKGDGLGGALYDFFDYEKKGETGFSTIVNCTFANNISGGYGGAWAVSGINGTTQGSVQNTIIANNRAYQQCGYPPPAGCVGYNTGNNCGSTLTDNGSNIEYPERPKYVPGAWQDPADRPCFARPVVFTSNTMPVINPLLAPPANNGGSTRTMALQAGSPAINAGSGCSTTDQRGVTRAGACDIGAYEYNTPLPVELISFAVVARQRVAHLSWSTASETNNAGFAVESSTDAQHFQRLGWVAGQGSAAHPTSYQFDDATLPAYPGPLVYYRLRQTDQNGTTTFSPVRSLAVPAGGSARLQLWPNPAQQRVTLSGPAPGQPVSVYDLSGRLVLRATLPLSGPPELALPTSLPRGSYLVRAGAQVGRLLLD
ncbi:hypothetical protein IC235_07355 [Hymenobacter sp. BT664]|uniref:T9SS type A sorting domain-containing protein n=1 Tax=Hymenobacter montanus TaxID=2771359 RepID=A0A927BBH9_9BACT|nr:choice-of-anchor Q domain-containing protein [Hymenobacter montanus]MBD2767707.1 hypothetical protein [Hymenobacter montanus]